MWPYDESLITHLLRRYFTGRAPAEGDDVYQRWLRETVTALVEHEDTARHAMSSDDERQWAQRAVAEGFLAWAVGHDAVILGAAWSDAIPRERSPYDVWLRNVHAAAAHEPYPLSGDQELAWARLAVGAGVFAWDIEGVSLVRVKSGDGGGAPYR